MKTRLTRWLLVLLACGIALPVLAGNKPPAKRPVAAKKPSTAPKPLLYGNRPDAVDAAQMIALRHGLDPAWVRSALAAARHVPQVTRWVLPAPAGTAKNWKIYRSRFIEPVRIQAGVEFWKLHADTLARAEQAYGVPAAIIVGIIGVETIYGRDTGSFRVLDVLATLSFDFPDAHPRAEQRRGFFRDELGQFLLLASRTGADPTGFKGSYAGAMGLPQFMPSSWLRYAVDFDGDGRTDLFKSGADAIGSVANYFREHGWQTGMATHYEVQFDNTRLDLEALLAPDILPTFSATTIATKGLVLEPAAMQHVGKLALVELQNGDAAPSFVVGTDNFYAITRYNWSSYYAMAVIELAREVASARSRQ